jgi:hypothetical protein
MVAPRRRTRTRHLRHAAALAGLATLVACGGSFAPPEVSAGPEVSPCYVAASGPVLRDTIVVAVPKPDAERFLAAHLVAWRRATDCTGREVPLAAAPFRAVSDNPVVLAPAPAERPGPLIRLQTFDPAGDTRDVIDAGADVVITSDPEALAYARGRGEFRLVPLAWATTYVLVSPAGSRLPVDTSGALRDELARDVVLAEARPAEPPFWWDGGTRCAAQPRDAAGRLPDIGIPSGDPVARALGERLIAIAPALPGVRRRLLPLGPSSFNYALSLGTVAAFVGAFPRFEPLVDCEGVPPVPVGSTIAALVDARATAVLRAGVPPFLIQGDGTIRFLHASRP